MMLVILSRGTLMDVPLSKRTVYHGSEVESKDECCREISMTVPARSLLEVGSICSTQVPGG